MDDLWTRIYAILDSGTALVAALGATSTDRRIWWGWTGREPVWSTTMPALLVAYWDGQDTYDRTSGIAQLAQGDMRLAIDVIGRTVSDTVVVSDALDTLLQYKQITGTTHRALNCKRTMLADDWIDEWATYRRSTRWQLGPIVYDL